MKTTIKEIISLVNETKSATDFSEAVKIHWLREAEAAIIDQIISGYVDYKPEDYNINYDANTPTDTELIAPVPYSRIYEYYLKAQIDYARDELELYHNDLAQYENAMSEFWKHYNRTHEHKNIQMRV